MTFSASSRMVNSSGLPMLIGPVTSGPVSISAHQAVDQVVDVAEGARLAAVAVDGDRLVRERLHDEVGDDAAVVRVHARAVGVEDARDLDRQLVLAVIVEEQGLGAALAFVVAGADADRIDVAPIVLGLRMDRGVAVDLAGRGLEDLAASGAWRAQHVDRAMDAGLGRLHGRAGSGSARPGRRDCRSRRPRR